MAKKDDNGSSDDSDAEKNLQRVGAFWKNESKSGNEYFNVEVMGDKFVAFENLWKETEKHPDYILYRRV